MAVRANKVFFFLNWGYNCKVVCRLIGFLVIHELHQLSLVGILEKEAWRRWEVIYIAWINCSLGSHQQVSWLYKQLQNELEVRIVTYRKFLPCKNFRIFTHVLFWSGNNLFLNIFFYLNMFSQISAVVQAIFHFK